MKVLIDFDFSESQTKTEQDRKYLVDFLEDQLNDYGAIEVLSIAEETEDIRDNYHSFKELYDHRIALFIALCNQIVLLDQVDQLGYGDACWKSKKHSDGSELDGWFIAGINQEAGQQISYHLPIEKWDELRVMELEAAPQWDGHTSQDVIERLKKI